MATAPANKFTLKGLHQEIDLYDRKIAHATNFETFESADDKQKAIDRLNSKREKLVKTARELMENGIEFDPQFLPRSFRSDANTAETPTEKSVAPVESKKPISAFGASIMDAEASQRAQQS